MMSMRRLIAPNTVRRRHPTDCLAAMLEQETHWTPPLNRGVIWRIADTHDQLGLTGADELRYCQSNHGNGRDAMKSHWLLSLAGAGLMLALPQHAAASASSQLAQGLQQSAVQVEEAPTTRTVRPPQRVPQRVPSRS